MHNHNDLVIPLATKMARIAAPQELRKNRMNEATYQKIAAKVLRALAEKSAGLQLREILQLPGLDVSRESVVVTLRLMLQNAGDRIGRVGSTSLSRYYAQQHAHRALAAYEQQKAASDAARHEAELAAKRLARLRAADRAVSMMMIEGGDEDAETWPFVHRVIPAAGAEPVRLAPGVVASVWALAAA